MLGLGGEVQCYPDAVQFEDEKVESVIRDVLSCGYDDVRARMFVEEGLLHQCRLEEAKV